MTAPWWPVLTLFLVPAGGGIPPGVLLAKSRGIPWPETAFCLICGGEDDVTLEITAPQPRIARELKTIN